MNNVQKFGMQLTLVSFFLLPIVLIMLSEFTGLLPRWTVWLFAVFLVWVCLMDNLNRLFGQIEERAQLKEAKK